VQDLGSVQQQLATSLTSLNLTGLSRIDYLYTLAMILTGLLVFALAVLLERGRDFAMLEALGTTPNQIGALLLIEIGYAVVVGSMLGLLVGLGFAQMLIQILTAIFDPPPDALAVPWSSLALVLAFAVFSGLIAWGIATIRLRQTNLAGMLRES
jgi:putative ABC transport system permease protein